MSLDALGTSDREPPRALEVGRWQIEPTLVAPRALRHDLLHRWGGGEIIDPVITGRVALVLTELVTNAVQHGEDSIKVTLGRTPDGWLVVVTEHPPPLARPLPRPTAWRQSSPDADPGGRGLSIVAAVSTRCGWSRRGGEFTIWAEVPGAPDAADSAAWTG